MRRILHAACPYTNIGDGALIGGIRRTLRELEPDLEFVDEDLLQGANNWGATVYDASFFERVAEEYDLLLVGGGGLIDSNRRSDRSGMMFNVEPELVRNSATPIVFYAVGHNVFRGMGYHHADKLRHFMRVVLDAKDHVLFSVRNDGSKRRLEEFLGYASDDIFEIPDPGIYVETRETYYPQFRPDRRNVLVNFSGDRPGYRFREFGINLFNRKLVLSHANERRFMERLARSFMACSEKHQINYIMTPHLTTDYGITGSFFANCPVPFTRYNIDATGILRGIEHAPMFFDIYRQADLVLGMRGHSVNCAVGLRRPFVGLASHDKVRDFLATCGLGKYAVEVLDPKLDVRLPRLMDELLTDPSEYLAICGAALDRFKKQTMEFNRRTLALMAQR